MKKKTSAQQFKDWLWWTWLLWLNLAITIIVAFLNIQVVSAIAVSILQVLIQVYGILFAFTAVIFSAIYASLSTKAMKESIEESPRFMTETAKPRYDALKSFLKASTAILITSVVGIVIIIPLVAPLATLPAFLLVMWTVPLCLEAGVLQWFATKV